MATHSSILAWRTPWTEEPDGLQSMGSQSMGQNCATNTFTFFSKKSPEALGVAPSGIIFFFPCLSYALLCISSSSGKPSSSSHLTASKTRFTDKEHLSLKSPSKTTAFPIGPAPVTWCPMSQSLCLDQYEHLIGQDGIRASSAPLLGNAVVFPRKGGVT